MQICLTVALCLVRGLLFLCLPFLLSKTSLWQTYIYPGQITTEASKQLALMVHRSSWPFNQIVCLAKGGLRVGDIICRISNQPPGHSFHINLTVVKVIGLVVLLRFPTI